MALLSVVAYVAISIHLCVVRRYGGVVAILLTTARKALSLILSFLLFPKAFSWLYVWGAVLVLGSILVSSIYRKQKQQRTLETQQLEMKGNVDQETGESPPIEKNTNSDDTQSSP
mmetsp:Transcript_16885/g.25794  ORF Transcript_16885/g.25794 Transcript_16885/m.25794 type:complete len:115 (-) Transcript_16885:180-524(-)